jgi:hypothetical protein
MLSEYQNGYYRNRVLGDGADSTDSEQGSVVVRCLILVIRMECHEYLGICRNDSLYFVMAVQISSPFFCDMIPRHWILCSRDSRDILPRYSRV